MGEYGLVWVHWDVGSMGEDKKVHAQTNRVVQALIWALWSGKFPRTSCFEEKNKRGVDGSGWVHMGSHGCSGVCLHGGTGQQG